jgi:hypothetical protein
VVHSRGTLRCWIRSGWATLDFVVDQLEEVLQEQAGLVTVDQLTAAGVSRSALQTRLNREWRFVLPRVVTTANRPLDDHQRLVAAALFAGPDAVISSLTAASRHGVRAAALDRRVRIAIPASHRLVPHGFVLVRRTRRPDERAWPRPPLLIASPARAVADAARETTQSRARALVVEAVQRRIVSTAALAHELQTGPRSGAPRLRYALTAAETGAWSVPEADLADLVATSGVLPEMWLNPVLRVGGVRLPTPDGWFDDVGLVVQVHSQQYHAGELQWEATVSADAVFAEHGIPVIAVTPRQIALTADEVLRRIERAYVAAALMPRPAVTALRVSAA